MAHEAIAECVMMLLPHFDVFCNLLLNRRTATWNLSVLYYEKQKKSFIYTSVLKLIVSKNQSNCEINLTDIRTRNAAGTLGTKLSAKLQQGSV